MNSKTNGRTPVPETDPAPRKEAAIASITHRLSASAGHGQLRGSPAAAPARLLHLIICTDSPENLGAVLRGAALQSRAPDSLSVAVDGEDPRITGICRTHALNTGRRIRLTQRRAHGITRLSQSRNNAVRTLFATGVKHGILLFIDGDIVLDPETIETHAALFEPGHLAIAGRIHLDRAQTAAHLATGAFPGRSELVAEQRRLRAMHRRTNRSIWLRRLGLSRAHKPDIIGAHFAMDIETFARVNGFDENFRGDGCEDEDFARRAYATGARPQNLILRTRAFRLFHETRSASRPADNSSGVRFRRMSLKPVCDAGLRTPFSQNQPHIQVL
ncbi:MAG: galactosyltransferase-related protein [Opitutaceae bacterium]